MKLAKHGGINRMYIKERRDAGSDSPTLTRFNVPAASEHLADQQLSPG